MLIDEQKLKHWIHNFYGYGTWHARVWFVAFEETGGEMPEEVADKINYFQQTHGTAEKPTLCDIRDLYKHVSIHIEGPKAKLFAQRFDYRFGESAVQHGVWKNLISFEHGYRNEPLPDLLSYQRETFLTTHRTREALINLYPLPSPHNHAWYYGWLQLDNLSFLKSRTAYQQHLYEQRINAILSNIKTYKPEVVVMYGMQNILALKKSVQQSFPKAQFSLAKSIKQEIPQHHQAELDGTVMLITTQIPALRHNRIETGFNWNKFGSDVRALRVSLTQ